MAISSFYSILLATSVTLLLAQLFVREKKTVHIIFAVFCGSIAMMAAKKLSGEYLGAYQYLIGMGACVTCNGYWLLSRSLFREKSPISFHHLLFAAVIALLVMTKQGYLFFSNTALVTTTQDSFAQLALNEITILLSSSVIVLSFWEGCRGFTTANKQNKAQRILFLSTFGLAVIISKISKAIFADVPQTQELVITLITFFVLINTYVLIRWKFSSAAKPADRSFENETLTVSGTLSKNHESNDLALLAETTLAKQVQTLICDESLFLQANLKVADLARELDVPEYRISKALRTHLSAKNFNQYINELRIKHAQMLLTDPEKHKWPVLVVGLESGFASVGPFTRAFKALTGFTPNQYRQHQLSSA